MNEAAFAAALSGLPGMGPATLVAIVDRYQPSEAWDAVLQGTIERPSRRAGNRRIPGSQTLPWPETAQGAFSPGKLPASWASVASRLDPEQCWERYQRLGVRVTWRGEADFPVALQNDPDPPGVLFWRGDLAVLQRPCVAIVGTRNATPEGRRVAFEMGRDLAGAGVCVVSGLALGIDGAAHAGVVRAHESRGGAAPAVGSGAVAGPVGVAASGVDVPYPRRHARLWEQVVDAGAVVSETPPGRPAQAWRFPSRNRVIAGLSELVVVVESHACGGSLITAEAAIERGIEVRAVPGPVNSPASVGTNQLLYDGPGPVRSAQDVLDALGLIRPAARQNSGVSDQKGGVRQPEDRTQRHVLTELGWSPVSPGRVMARTGLSAAAIERILNELLELGLARQEGGWWYRTG
jgi:DNA processing protein